MGDGKGLYLLVMPAGGKSCRMDYRFDEKRRTMTFDRDPQVGLVNAREKRDAAREQIRDGIDPGAEVDFLRRLIAAVLYKVHILLTDNGIHFTTQGSGGSAAPLIKEAIASGGRFWAHSFELACAQNNIDHRLTKPRLLGTTDRPSG